MHMLCHLFDDVQGKGVSANYSTKPSEQMHRKLRSAYGTSSKKLGTVDSEVLHTTHAYAVYKLIEAEIEEFKASQTEEADDEDKPEEIFHIRLGSRDRTLSTELLEEKHNSNPACQNLAAHIHEFVGELDPMFVQAGETIEV
ncbi:hypothetical protein FRC06_003413 [Ceratobasidium sp. 370]|nr:hypothetical protein FRC06_003413 [Ceratobasidium sp. 370]